MQTPTVFNRALMLSQDIATSSNRFFKGATTHARPYNHRMGMSFQQLRTSLSTMLAFLFLLLTVTHFVFFALGWALVGAKDR
jgi:hypothetical protein